MAPNVAFTLTLFLLAHVTLAHAADCSWWYELTPSHGFSFRNASAFGVVGDGVADDTDGLQAAIDFNRGSGAGSNADTSAAIVYLPPGRYRLTNTLVLWKWTKLLGNARCPPTLLLSPHTPGFDGTDGLQPLIASANGFNSSLAEHAWWEEDAAHGSTNELFFSQIHNVRIELGAGNPGVVGLMWNVAQQTSLRNLTIVAAADAAIALDVGAGQDYNHFNAGAPLSLGGGGVVEDVTITGARVGLRVAAAQFLLRSISISGCADVGIRVWQLAWSLVFLDMTIDHVPLGVDLAPSLPGHVSFLDSRFSHVTLGTAFSTGGAPATASSSLILQNIDTDGSVDWVVDTTLPATPGGGAPSRVDAWTQGAVFVSGTRRNAPAGALPLPSLADAAAQGVALACGSGRNRLCGGSVEDPSTGVPHVPLPNFADADGVLNAHAAGAVGDGVHDDTSALQAAFLSSRTVFIPFGIYLISATITTRPDSRIVGEGLSVLLLAEDAPGFGPRPAGSALTPMLVTPPNSTVQLADLELWSMHCGNGGALLLQWGGGGSLHDVGMLVGATVGAKAILFGNAPTPTYISNSWWPASTAYDPTVSSSGGGGGGALRAWGSVRATLAALPSPIDAVVPTCLFTQVGTLVASTGPIFAVGVNFEHAIESELVIANGTRNAIIVGLQTEESLIALTLQAGSVNTVLWGGLFAFWNASVVSPAQVVAERGAHVRGTGLDVAANFARAAGVDVSGHREEGGAPCVQPPPGGVDLAYRAFGVGVPIATSEEALLVDVGCWVVPVGTDTFSGAAGVINVGPGAGVAGAGAAAPSSADAAPPLAPPLLRIYVIAGQSNAEGQAEVATKNSTGQYLNGTLAYQLSDPRTAALFASLWDESRGNWTILPDVKIWYNEVGAVTGVNGSQIPSGPGDAAFGNLTTGYGCAADPNLIGPELGFGFRMHESMSEGEHILIMKTAWGGKTLAGDFRPPSSVATPDPYCQGACPNVIGHFYKVMVEDVHKMLAPGAVSAMFPDLVGLTPTLSGIGWQQGWNDGCDLNETAAYEQNLVHFIADLREEFASPFLPFSINVAGFDGFNGAEAARVPKSDTPWIDLPPAEKISTNCGAIDHGCRRLDIALSQLAAGNATRHPELGGHVVTSETRGFWRDAQFSPNAAQGYHYFHNAETYYLMGRAMAEGMLAATAA